MTSCFRLKPLALLLGTVFTLLSSLGTAHAAFHPEGLVSPLPAPVLSLSVPTLLARPEEHAVVAAVPALLEAPETLEPPPQQQQQPPALLLAPLFTEIPGLLSAPTEPIETLGGIMSPVDPIDPKRLPHLSDPSIHTDLWARVRSGFGMGSMGGMTGLVQQHEQRFTAQADHLKQALERGSRYLFHIVEEVQKRGMPTELALLPFIESAFNPQATSSARATGMWQFMAHTGRNLDLKQNMFRDDRRDVLASTRAALDYLVMLKQKFGTWPHALVAYNWGEGNLRHALQRNSRAGRSTDLASLAMPKETRNYVPKLLAIRNVINRPQSYALSLPALENHPYFLSVPVTRDMDVDLVVRLAELSRDEFQSLNPSLNRPVILAAGTPQVLLPFDNADRFLRNLVVYQGALSHWTAWTAPRTMTPSEVAQHTGMNETALREVNSIPPRMLIQAGSTLLVARDALRSENNVSEHLADNAFMHLMPEAGGRKHSGKITGHARVAHLRERRVAASSSRVNRRHIGTVVRQLATKN